MNMNIMSVSQNSEPPPKIFLEIAEMPEEHVY